MTHPRLSNPGGKGRSRLAFWMVASGAVKTAHNYRYEKYTERYQYVKRLSSGCHGGRIALLSGLSTNDHRNRIRFDGNVRFAACENVLRNRPILQQVCAC